MIPGVEQANGCAVALDSSIDRARDRDPEGFWAGVWGSFELPTGLGIGFGNDLTIVGRVGCGLDPRAQGHASGQLQKSGIAEVNKAVKAIEAERFSAINAVVSKGRV